MAKTNPKKNVVSNDKREIDKMRGKTSKSTKNARKGDRNDDNDVVLTSSNPKSAKNA